MFPAEKEGEWEPTKIRSVATSSPPKHPDSNQDANQTADVEMKDEAETADAGVAADAPATQPPEETSAQEPTYEEDPHSVEGAVYPVRGGRVENWPCFLALLTHIFNTLSPPWHTPVLVISQPCWNMRDHELLTQFFFETFKIPAFGLVDAALATSYAYGIPTATVIDVGHEKCDITAVSDFIVCDVGRGVAVEECGGQAMTKRLLGLLERQGFDENICDQLKKSPICEILPVGTEMPGSDQSTNPAAAASTGATDSGADAKVAGQVPKGPGLGTEIGEAGGNGNEEEIEGVLDVASIVAKGNTSEYLARREKEKAEKAAAKKSGGPDGAKPARLKNSEKEKATFSYEEYLPVEGDANGVNGVALPRKRKRDVEVGIERFMAATPSPGSLDSILDRIAAAIHRTILSVPEVANRGTLWDNLIILGNGSRVRGSSLSTYFLPSLLTKSNRIHDRAPCRHL